MGRVCRNVQGTSDTLSLRDPSFILVRLLVICVGGFSNVYCSGFIVKVKKILECICVNCGRLKGDIVSRVSFPLLVSHPTPNFLGALSLCGEPQARTASVLDNRGVLLPVVWSARVVGRLIAARTFANARCWLDTRLRGEMGG